MESCVTVRRKEVACKGYMKRIMNDKNDWNHNVEGDAIEGPVVVVVMSLHQSPSCGV